MVYKRDTPKKDKVDAEAPAGSQRAGKEPNVGPLLTERLAVLREIVELQTKDYQRGAIALTQVLQASQRVLKAELELAKTDKERLAILEKQVAGAKQIEDHAAQQHKAGVAPYVDILNARAARLEAKIELERTKAKMAPLPK